jgi:heat shock protein HslJ
MSKMRLMFLFGLSVLAVGLVVGIAIGIDSFGSPPDSLEGTWVLKCYGEPGKLRVPYPWNLRGDITLTISACATAEQKIGDYLAHENIITGYAGVNWYHGNYEGNGNKCIPYTVHGEEKHVGSLSRTEMAGPSHLMAQEDRYLHILTSAQTYEITNGILIISSGEELLGFKRKG